MSNTNTGGPAFPQNERVTAAISIAQSQGMTLRDYFAAKALVAVIADPDTKQVQKIMNQPFQIVAAHVAYGFADAMMKAREA